MRNALQVQQFVGRCALQEALNEALRLFEFLLNETLKKRKSIEDKELWGWLENELLAISQTDKKDSLSILWNAIVRC